MKEQEFNEAEYLEANPDVAAAVKEWKFHSGRDHYEKYGESEGRLLKQLFGRTSREEKVFHLLDKTGLGLEIGPSQINEAESQLACNEVYFCLRARKIGYRNIRMPYTELYRHESTKRSSEETSGKQVRFAREVQCIKHCWGILFLNGPAYNRSPQPDFLS